MALLFKDQVYTQEDNTNLELTPKSGEDIVVKDIYVYNPASDFVTVTISQSTVGYFRVNSIYFGNHLPYPLSKEQMTIIGYFMKMGLFQPYPIQENETFAIAGAAQAGAAVSVLYDRYSAGDIKNTQPNGSKATERYYIQYGRSPGSLSDGLNTINVPLNPVQFDKYPFGERVPDGSQLDIHALLATPVGYYISAASQMNYKYIKMIKNEDILGDVFNLDGYFYEGNLVSGTTRDTQNGRAVGGNMDDNDSRTPFMFNPPVTGEGGTILTAQINATQLTGSAQISTIGSEVAFLIHKMNKRS